MTKIQRPYGMWKSPITPYRLAQKGDFTDIAWDADGALVWREVRGGEGILVVRPADKQAPRDLSSDFSTRAQISYGGGEFAVMAGQVYFVEAQSGRIYKQALVAGPPRPVTPGFGSASAAVISPDERWLLYIHSYEERDCLGLVDVEGELWPTKLVSGDDFYMHPVWHPNSNQIAWVAWSHPNMPWDGAFLYLADLVISGEHPPALGRIMKIAGDNDISVMQPAFSPDGRYLAYISDESGWWQIYLHNLESGHRRQVTDGNAEHGRPAWLQGIRIFDFSPDSKGIYYIRNVEGIATLWLAEVDTGAQVQIQVGDEYTWIEQPAVSPDGQSIAMIASGADTPPRIILHTFGGETIVIGRAMVEDLPPKTYSLPRPISWLDNQGERIFGLFYSPENDTYEGIGLPPLIVQIHGGPTSQRTASFDPEVQFFTSRGYAVLQVNYRGSSGYGRNYRNMLRGNWGVYDVEDAMSGARYVVDRGWVEKGRLVIMGGSAGGYTVLKALEDYPGFFKAGIDLYGISNQLDFLFDTHKFEAHYNDALIGPYPQAAQLYRERSPIFFLDKIVDPLAVFQGAEDRIVPRNQSDEVIASLKQRGIPHLYQVYEGEGHGFRKPETIAHYYEAVERFLRQHVVIV